MQWEFDGGSIWRPKGHRTMEKANIYIYILKTEQRGYAVYLDPDNYHCETLGQAKRLAYNLLKKRMVNHAKTAEAIKKVISET